MRSSAILALIALSAVAISDNPPKNNAFGTKLKSVAVFRDGFGYYVREGQVKLENGWATTDFVPTAIKGSVWFYTADKSDRIDSIVMTKENELSFSSPTDIKTKLADKVGLRLVVQTNGGQRFDGELAKILDDMLLLKVGDAYNAVPYGQVRSITLPGYPVKIKIDSKDPNKVVTIGVAYLQDGIRWEPSYILDVSKGQASLDLRASINNTTEKLDKTDVYFVVGSPFVSNRGVQDILGPVPNAPAAGTGVAVKTPESEKEREREREHEKDETPVVKAAVTRDEAGELYYYRKSDLTLSTGDIAMVSIFSASVPVTPSYEWNADGDEVAYLLGIQNKSKEPLTTGPVLVLEDGKAIGQETIRYTPAGGSTEVRLARGIGLKVEKTEAEVKRGAAVKIGKTDFIPVTLKGTLTVTNYRPNAVALKVTKTLRGKVGEISDAGKLKQTQILSGEPNPINDLEWKVSIPVGGTKTITYTLETYMSSERAGSPPVPSTPDEDDR